MPGHALRINDWLLWARRTFVIRTITPGVPDVAWLTLAEILPGHIRENAMDLPIVLSADGYRRVLR